MVFDDYGSDLSNLIWLRFTVILLKIEFLFDTFLSVNMMASAYPFLKA